MNSSFWQGKRVLVTGHTGFKGAWLTLLLSRLGAKVFGFALEPEKAEGLFVAANVGRHVTSVIGDIRDAAAMNSALNDAAPEVVFHLAAQALVLRSYEQPVETYSTNVLGTAQVLDCCRQCSSLRAVVVITSDKVYENREWPWGYRENDSLGGKDPYSNSKACAELVVQSFRTSFFNRWAPLIATARAGNVIGGGDWSDNRIIPDFVRAIVAGRPLLIRNPSSVRPWQHVLEPLEGYLLLAQRLFEGKMELAEAWNFGPTSESFQAVSNLADGFASSWGAGARWYHESQQQPHEAHLLTLDASKARARLGWQPRWGYVRGVAETARWYRAQLDNLDLERFSLEQIESFMEQQQ